MERQMLYQRMELAPSSWRGRIVMVIGAALALGLAAAFVILSLGIALLLLPVIGVALAVGWWRWRRLAAAMSAEAAQRNQAQTSRVIETDYEILENRRRDDHRRR
jgi:membrane protein implicated in regulation of membrane protease activity